MLATTPVDVSIIVVSYNTRAMTAAALSSIHAQTRVCSYEVIVVDNASTDGSAEMIAHHPLQPALMALSENIGFARANNRAVLTARGRYVLLLNPDTIVLDTAIDRLVAFADANRNAGIWGGRTVFADGRLNPASCWSRMTAWTLFCRTSGLAVLFANSEFFNGEAIGGWRRNTVRHVDIVSGCFFLIEHDLWDRLQGFDPAFFMYGEEADLCLRARTMSARPMITPDATIVHYGGASETVRADKMIRLLAAKMTLIMRHWTRISVPLGRALLSGWPLSRRLAMALAALVSSDDRITHSAATWREVWRRRSEWQRGYRSTHPSLSSPSLAPMAAATPIQRRPQILARSDT